MKKRENVGTKLLAMGLSVLLAINMFHGTGILETEYTVMAETIAQVTPGVTNLNVRQEPNTNSTILTKISGGQELTILDQPDTNWYHVTFTKSGTTDSYTGYVSAEFVTVTNTGGGSQAPADGDFEAYLTAQGFPESYKPYLRDLHALHSDWKFVAVQTGLDWNTVIENERNKQGQIKNLVQGTASAPHYNWRETSVGYDWASDTWYSYDGSTWFAASKDLVSYYMDPRTYLYETYIFAFEQLSYDSSVHNAAGVEAILANSFMWNSCPTGETRTFSDILMEAAATYDVSPYHLASRMRQEMGVTAGVNATGTSTNYPGIFNFFNVGSVDSAGGGAVNKGLAWASLSGTYGRPWNSAYKAIMGGSEFIGKSYINRGQDTLYTQKFNVVYTGNLYGHQYMTNVQAPASEAASMYKAYKNNGLLNSALVFKIPVYQNMPETAVAKPADSGSPNNWLSSLSISGYSLTPTFTGGNTDYSLIVSNDVSSVSVSATTVHTKASIAGIGSIALAVGTNVVPITVTAQNGTTRTYNITIVRKDASGNIPDTPAQPGTPEQPNTPVQPSLPEGPTMNTTYKISGTQLSGISVGTDAATMINGLGISSGTATVYKSDGTTVNTGTVGTGNIVRVSDGTNTYSYTVVIYGDVSGDGLINALDLLKIQKHLIGAASLDGAYLEAANVKRSGSVSALDLLKVQKQIIGAAPIQQ